MQHKKPKDAKALLDSGAGWIYLDVRSEGEFENCHPEGAWNVPVMHRSPLGMAPNDDFVAVVRRVFPADAKFVVGCASGVRSVRACELLEAAGFKHLVNMEGGFVGARDPFGRAVPGWAASGLPVANRAAPERTYPHLAKSKP